jgi:hypothetical protein
MKSSSRSGFSLIEVAAATVALGSIGYVLSFALKAAADSQREITTRASDHRVVRAASRDLLDQLSMAGEDTIAFAQAIPVGEANETALRFQVRIEEGSVATFGVLHLGVPRTGWSVVYAVEEPSGASDTRRLVQRLEDEAGVQQSSTIVARGLRADDAVPPGFRVVKAGDLWEITLSTEGIGGRSGIEEVFHVRARN